MVKEFSKKNQNTGKETITRNAKIWLSEEGIVWAVYSTGSEETLEDAEVNLGAVEKVCRGKKYPIFINPGPHKAVSREARIYYVKNSPKYATAIAVLMTSSFAKVLATFLSSLNKTINKGKFSVKFFLSEDKALDWLREFMHQKSN